MDETSLLALGILMEEICRDTLGETGDMVFTEGTPGKRDSYKSLLRECEQSAITSSEAALRSGRTRTGKRRRLDAEATSN